ncbi:MAG: GntR family transcriptional regulator [Chloroflexota bacterium]
MLIDSPVPLYYQVATHLRHRILDGAYQPGERIGTEMEMCEQFRVSRITVRQALEELERERLIVRRRARGTFVSQQLPERASITFTGFLEDIFAQAYLTESREVERLLVRADAEVARALRLQEGDTVVQLRRVRLLSGSPFAHVVNYLPLGVGNSITTEALRQTPLMPLMENELGVTLDEATQTVCAVLATPELAAKLDVHEGAPLLLVQRTVYAEGRPMDYAQTHYRADRYQYSMHLGRIPRGHVEWRG